LKKLSMAWTWGVNILLLIVYHYKYNMKLHNFQDSQVWVTKLSSYNFVNLWIHNSFLWNVKALKGKVETLKNSFLECITISNYQIVCWKWCWQFDSQSFICPFFLPTKILIYETFPMVWKGTYLVYKFIIVVFIFK
jgi:hypothetical protein